MTTDETTEIEREVEATRAGLPLSVTDSDAVHVPTWIGVPESVPATGSSPMPGGKVPVVMLHVYGGSPPVAVADPAYGEPTMAVGVVVPAMLNGGTAAWTRSTSIADADVARASVTRIVRVKVPLVVGVPAREPLDGSSASPGGSIETAAH